MDLREVMDRAERLKSAAGAIVVLIALLVLLLVGWAAVGRSGDAAIVVALVAGAAATIVGTWIGASAGSAAREDAEEARDRAVRAVMLLAVHADPAVAREALVSAGMVEDAAAAGVPRPGTVRGPRASRDARATGFGLGARVEGRGETSGGASRGALWAPQSTDGGDEAAGNSAT